METGFPSPAQGYEEAPINLGSYLVPRPVSTYFMKIDTDRYTNFSISKGDIVVIDRSLPVLKDSLCVGSCEDGFLLCKLDSSSDYNKFVHISSTKKSSISKEISIFGIITFVIHSTH